MEKKTDTLPGEKKVTPGACPFCGYITPFDPYTPGFCCPVCGAQSGTIKKED